MEVAFFINQYPKVSHSFIRREIMALEAKGVAVHRYALRGWSDAVVDAEDKVEQAKTRYVLRGGLLGLLKATLLCALLSPRKWALALRLAFQAGLGADRPLPLHLVYFAEACQLRLWLRQTETQHVHAHFGTNSAEVVMLAHALGGPGYSFTVHGPEEFDKPQALKLSDKIKHSRFVVAISAFGRSQLWRWLPYADWIKVKEVHCGLDKRFYDVPVTAVPAAQRLVCVGRLCEQKGQLLLIDAARRLRDRGHQFELVLAGDGDMRAEIERLVSLHQLGKLVRITGWISSDQVRAELQSARALVLPSFAEGLPVVIMEAMALGRPVLSTYVAGIPELVHPGLHGWLFPAGDIEALTNAMQACLESPPERLAEMGEQARARVLDRHNADTEAGKLLAFMRQSLESDKP